MRKIDWSKSRTLLQEISASPLEIRVIRSGLPFLDALSLYGAIELYFGLNESVKISDHGGWWSVKGRILNSKKIISRRKRYFERLEMIKAISKKERQTFIDNEKFDAFMIDGLGIKDEKLVEAKGEFSGLDPTLQWGIRGIAAHSYETLQSSQTSKTECIVKIPLSTAILASIGKKRVETIGDITFLPVFKGSIDFSKVVRPLRFSTLVPNIICAQAMALLTLRTTLFSEGYYENLHMVVYKTDLIGNRSDNYSGLINIGTTAIGKANREGDNKFLNDTYVILKSLVEQGWRKSGKKFSVQDQAKHALATSYWLMKPDMKNLETLVSSQEQLYSLYKRVFILFKDVECVRRVFEMTHEWNGNHEMIRKFAQTVERAIFAARMKGSKEPEKEWYNEVAILRSAPTERDFFEHTLVLIEQGHKEDPTVRFDNEFDPIVLMNSVNQNRFENFRILFRMYLIQASKPKSIGQITTESGPLGILPENKSNKESEDTEE